MDKVQVRGCQTFGDLSRELQNRCDEVRRVLGWIETEVARRAEQPSFHVFQVGDIVGPNPEVVHHKDFGWWPQNETVGRISLLPEVGQGVDRNFGVDFPGYTSAYWVDLGEMVLILPAKKRE